MTQATSSLADLKTRLLADVVACLACQGAGFINCFGGAGTYADPESSTCEVCHGTGTQPRFPLLRVEAKWWYELKHKWVWNPDPDAVGEAIRAEGWILKFWSFPNEPGDTVAITTDTILVMVTPSEQLRGTVAILTAVARAAGV